PPARAEPSSVRRRLTCRRQPRSGRGAGGRRRRRCGADCSAAEDGVSVVEDGGLALGHATGGVVQADAYLVAVQPGRAGVPFAVGAELDEALRGLRGRGAAGPDGAGRGDLGDVEAFGGTNGGSTGHRLGVGDVAGLAVAGRGADPQAAALADGEGVGAVVLAEDGAGLVDDLAWRLAQLLGQEAAGVAVGDEADVVAVRLVRDREPAPRGLGA